MIEKMSDEKCYLCGSNTKTIYEFKSGLAKDYSIIKCMKCNLMRTFPLPELKDIKG